MDYGLIGEHLGHSFSRDIHERLGRYTYDLCELSPDQLESFMRARVFKAINVTIPYKERVIPLLDVVDDDARAIGAVNTVVNRDGRLYGYNTDALGMKALIRHAGVSVQGRRVLILGTGGTSKTARAVAQSLGAVQVTRASRTAREDALSYEDVYARMADAQVIINTTPCGMFPNNGTAAVSLDAFSQVEGVIDVVYNPLRTALVLDAQSREIPAEGGLYMLVAQAVYAAELFLGEAWETDGLIADIYHQVLLEKENIVLIGMPGSGKTTIGALLARKLGRDFVDTDDAVADHTGLSAAEIIRTQGEAAFRTFESACIAQAGRTGGRVIACGGGAVLSQANVDALAQNGLMIYVSRPLAALQPSSTRPLAATREQLAALYEQRRARYEEVADVQVTIGADETPEQAAAAILKKVQE